MITNKSIFNMYVMHQRLATSDVIANHPMKLLDDETVTEIEAAINDAAPSLSPLERIALQGRLDGLTNSQLAQVTGYSAAYISQALSSAIRQLDFSTIQLNKIGEKKS